jgi:hypothetical protein
MGVVDIRRVIPEACVEERSSVDSLPKEDIAAAGRLLASRLRWLPQTFSSGVFRSRCLTVSTGLGQLKSSLKAPARGNEKPEADEDLLWLRENLPDLATSADCLLFELGAQIRLPVVVSDGQVMPRVLALAQEFIEISGSAFSTRDFAVFCQAFEESCPLDYHEVGALVPALKLVILETILAQSKETLHLSSAARGGMLRPWLQIFRYVARVSWRDELESLIPFDSILSQDPADAYSQMDLETRSMYREQVAEIARRSGRSEMQIAQEAVALALERTNTISSNSRIALRETHVGYYLAGEGASFLYRRIGLHPASGDWLRAFLQGHADDVLLGGIVILNAAICTVFVTCLTPASTPPLLVLLAMLAVLIPASQAAVLLMNSLITNLLRARPLPKMDFSKGIPDDCMTLVAIPTLLLNEKQVRTLLGELEVRFSGNHDRNLHFAIVSDLPDANLPSSEDHALVRLCSDLIAELNNRYSGKSVGSFFHLHRHRIYNPSEKGWMGWERKRGKLLDLNQLLCGGHDRFPVKVGDISILRKVRFVITLDSDTKLPRGAAQRMIGTLAHPLNRAIVDPVFNIVVKGYGILQPRVGVSTESLTRSRLAAIFAGETRVDPYTRAVSDVYQDLYREGIFTGKGIYEVDTMFRVLNKRFPRNLLLSHDLLEGAYARVGLVTDIVVMEDYPSHYSAFNRRKHRWVRGDWQIMEWLPDYVIDEGGSRVPNPISLISRWKILDNIRRSLVDPATCALLLVGWFVTGRPFLWTIATILILLLPALAELAVRLISALFRGRFRPLQSAFTKMLRDASYTFLSLILLAHQALVSLDAIGRALVRRWVTRKHLLEWETAAQAELGRSRTWVERSLGWFSFFALGLGALIWWVRPSALWAAAPVLFLWACTKPVVRWLDARPTPLRPKLAGNDVRFLRRSALHIWRYFREFSNAEHNWLIPDNVQDVPCRVDGRVSPTNVGLLLNARQVAVELGYLTPPEMAELTTDTLETLNRLPKYCGHLFNWYDTRTLHAACPLFVSSVDSGNLVASLWTLEQGCLQLLNLPLISQALAVGFSDYLRALGDSRALPKHLLRRSETLLRGDAWLEYLLNFPDEVWADKRPLTKPDPAVAWFRHEARERLSKIGSLVENYVPWRLPQFAPLNEKLFPGGRAAEPPLEKLPEFIAELRTRVHILSQTSINGDHLLAVQFAMLLRNAEQQSRRLVEKLRDASEQAHELAEAMHFDFLLNTHQMQLSVGLDAASGELQPYSYGLLASEARTAVFVAIAKDDIPEECWSHLGRPVSVNRQVLLSWTGTMFEYAMPALWMRTHPGTVLDHAIQGAVREQKEYAKGRGVLWGISESACAKRNDAGDYQYEAFGVPMLAQKKGASSSLVVSPYSTLLVLPIDREAALANLRKMEALGWFGTYGFIEAADYSASRRPFRRPELVQSWMAHHQAMSLLSIANVLLDNVVQRWFHTAPRVQATELLAAVSG